MWDARGGQTCHDLGKGGTECWWRFNVIRVFSGMVALWCVCARAGAGAPLAAIRWAVLWPRIGPGAATLLLLTDLELEMTTAHLVQDYWARYRILGRTTHGCAGGAFPR
jgi:hypothetical protein